MFPRKKKILIPVIGIKIKRRKFFMNMKKLMAVVLAVVLAISAMAVNVFAAKGEVIQIPLRPDQNRNSNATATYTIEVPMYNLYGYADYNSYLELYLPNTFTDDLSIRTNVDYYLEASGEKVLIAHLENWREETAADGTKTIVPKSTGNYNDNISTIYETIFVNFGAFKRDWNQWSSGEDHWATVPQTVAFNTTNTLKLTANVTLVGWTNGGYIPVHSDGKFNNSWEKPADTLFTQLWTAGDDSIKSYGAGDDIAVTGSKIWAKNMHTSVSTDFSNPLKPFMFLSSEKTDTAEANYVDLTWDMTLLNRGYILNAESVDLVVKFHNGSESNWMGATTKGTAMYRLYMSDTMMNSTDIGQNWWNLGGGYNRSFKDIAYMNINNEEVSELRFAISPEKLVDTTYGFSAGMTSTFRIFAQYEQPASNFFQDSWSIHYNHWSNNAYLEVTLPAVDDSQDIIADDPVQSTEDGDDLPADDNPTEDPTVDEPEDTNPPTGIVLAVLPMVVAAAAVVASKRR